MSYFIACMKWPQRYWRHLWRQSNDGLIHTFERSRGSLQLAYGGAAIGECPDLGDPLNFGLGLTRQFAHHSCPPVSTLSAEFSRVYECRTLLGLV
jgi:hypothetical protein